MRRLLPSRSPVWWVVILMSLSAVGVFMIFEVLDLDGSDLYKRLFQPPIPSQPTLAEAEGVMRHGAFPVQKALGQLCALVILLQYSTGCSSPSRSLCALRARRLLMNRPRPHIHGGSFTPTAPGDEPPSIPASVV